MDIERAMEILDPEHREKYDSIETVNEACRMGREALRQQLAAQGVDFISREAAKKAFQTRLDASNPGAMSEAYFGACMDILECLPAADVRPVVRGHEECGEQLEFRETELYQEIAIYHNGLQVGEAEIELTKKMLSKLVIYDSCQDKGYGTEAVKRLTENYGIRDLWVKANNKRAIRCYKKCGYKMSEPTMFRMESPNCGADMREDKQE